MAIFKPAKLVMSVLDQSDSSSLSRDVENENLIYTLSQSPLLPTGFGFDYQYSPNNPPVDLSGVFANFRLIAHNGVLWMWSWGGVIGFTLLWQASQTINFGFAASARAMPIRCFWPPENSCG